jgi:hypothetical protein
VGRVSRSNSGPARIRRTHFDPLAKIGDGMVGNLPVGGIRSLKIGVRNGLQEFGQECCGHRAIEAQIRLRFL